MIFKIQAKKPQKLGEKVPPLLSSLKNSSAALEASPNEQSPRRRTDHTDHTDPSATRLSSSA